MGVLAQEHALHGHARKLLLALEQVGDHVGLDVLLDGGGRVGQRLELVGDAAVDPARAGAQHAGQAPVELHPLALVVGQLAGRDLHGQAGAVVHQHPAVAVHDLAARRLHLDLAHAVVVGLGLVLVAREHLQVPEAEEDDPEGHQRDAADQRHAEGQLGRERAAVLSVEVHQTSIPRRPSGPLSRGLWRRRRRSSGSTARDGPDHAAHQPEHGQGDQRVEDHGHDHLTEDQPAHAGGPHVEHERHGAEGKHPARRRGRSDRDRQQAVRGIAQLAEAAHAVAHRAQHQRGGAHGLPRQQVEQEAGAEAGGRAGHAARVVGHAGHHQRHQVEVAAEDADLAQPGELDDHGGQQQPADAQEGSRRRDHGAGTPARAPGRSVSTCTKSIRRRSANGLMCTRW